MLKLVYVGAKIRLCKELLIIFYDRKDQVQKKNPIKEESSRYLQLAGRKYESFHFLNQCKCIFIQLFQLDWTNI